MRPGKTRFAPSPTGFIHLGNARTALFNRLAGERFLLRIEDTDRERCRTEYVAALIEDLQWLGIDWDEGPHSAAPDDYFQSRRQAIYDRYYACLEQAGSAYPCFCSPEELAQIRARQRAAGQPPRYPGTCARLSPEEVEARLARGLKSTLRFRVPPGRQITFDDLIRGPQAFRSDDIGDFIIRRADGTPAFLFCNAVDDALMAVTHVLRGEDHLANTPRQLLILEALRLTPPRYGHLPLILGDDGAPLSKRNGSRSIRELRQQGYLPLAVVNLLARLGHHYREEALLTLAELSEGFDLAAIGKSPARFDPQQLDYWQKQAVHAADDAILWDWLDEATRTLIPAPCRSEFLSLVRSNCLFPKEARHWAEILFGDAGKPDPDARRVLEQTPAEFFQAALEAARRHPEDYQAFVTELKTLTGVKGKRLFQPLRAALSGRLDGPELERLYRLPGPGRVQTRLARWITHRC
ncbi:nondiscriminating glutamyl-tRNA synthetase [Methylomarinovum tepidoasis]|uniref:Glutamate--tRNA ligase n=1 Tax=Methylomarinovum tepidoasis TaxID=2840183 RepID=A0AAU9C923_9GAMM|nr:glutamate--tRNA ligase [Methylomarinovum sp. IN45]BCX88920.1 nondiscriminating glutamyl-tRNA synthetase [Methylomarinovum sp. IN45]